MNFILKGAVALGLLAAPAIVTAQEYPTSQVTVVVPFAPGGSVDVMGRYVSDRLSRLWGQAVVVENRTGAGSAIGSAHVSQARPDGYTLLVVSSSFTTNAATQPSLPFDPVQDLKPVAVIALGDRFVSTGPRLNIGSLEDLVREAKSQKIFYGTNGVGSLAHMTGELMNDVLGIEMEAVHYKGGSEVMVDLGGGRIDVAFSGYSDLASGIGKPISVLSDERSSVLPDVPTVAESGFAEVVVPNWWGVFAPAGVPDDVLAKLHADVVQVMSTPEAVEFLATQAAIPSAMTTVEFTGYVADEITRWRGLAEKAGMIE
jgi:tripartite-type tricarboxylate transporter receptor subunit TctC